ncbi:MAG: methylated-DNA--[protein]-cysteine S-methyltransferase [Alphaproteobacteria bacterium]|jgi:methylated-DNA-[protein]-cysteine S-methyltransferase|nr:methylated-DNA--[protein]-cysteine S-methyltransferase [Alphaproteobacteria bacterium]
MPQLSLHSPVGPLTVTQEDGAIVALDWGWGRDQNATPLLERALAHLNAYFDGKAPEILLPLAPAGTDFQQRVWRAMSAIPYGATLTYGGLATESGGSARAVGVACGANPIPILIPCHRVVAASGLGGYSGDGGLDTKIALLRLEGVLL